MTAELLTALRLGDSAFPSGAFGYSWGLEALLADGQVTRAGLEDFLAAELRGRWHGVDRPALAGGWRSEDIEALCAWDDQVDACLWSDTPRRQSAEAGAALLAAGCRLDMEGAQDARAAVRAGRMAGHAACLTGYLYRGAGLTLDIALLVSAQGFLRAQISAAVRLGQAGALQGQAMLARLTPDIPALATPPEPGTLPCGFAPLTDIALMRPPEGRLFVN